MPLNSETKRKVRKLLAALKPLERGELIAEQLREDIGENLNTVIQNFNSKIKQLKDDLLAELGERFKQVPDLSEEVLLLESEIEGRLEELEKEEIPNIQTQMQDMASNSIEDKGFIQDLEKKFQDKIEEIRDEFHYRISNRGGGNANRQINVNSSVMSNYYADINFQQFGNIGWTATNDHDLKRVNIRASILTGGGGITRTVSVLSVSSTLAATATTDYTFFINDGIRVTLPTAIANTNRYSIKNISTSSVQVATTAGQSIDDGSTALLSSQYESVDIISNGSVWGIY